MTADHVAGRHTFRLWSAILVALGLSFAGTPSAQAAITQSELVIENPVDWTPSLVRVDGETKPIVEAMAVAGGNAFVGGRFSRLTQGGSAYNRQNVAMFDASTGTLSSANLNANNRIRAMVAIGNWVYIGGQFTDIGGSGKRNLVRVNAFTGAVDPGFTSAVRGRVNALATSGGRLFVGGTFTKKLVQLNPVTGADTNAIDLDIANQLPNSWGGVTIQGIAVNPAATKLVATGNFMSVEGQVRHRLFVADVSTNVATLDPWYYDGFLKQCATDNPRRVAQLYGVDFSPDGRYFSVAATGQIPRSGDLFVNVCDAVGRFALADDSRPQWINYTGGDSVWAVADVGIAVYTQGHFQWLDNPYGFASRDGGGAARRVGVGAIDPVTGDALPWDPRKPSSIGGKVLVPTENGLWVPSDSLTFAGEPRRGIAFVPLP